LRHELDSQDLPQPELEKRFRKREEAEEKRKQTVREEREREAVEERVADLSIEGPVLPRYESPSPQERVR
jgi:hypothetical protein